MNDFWTLVVMSLAMLIGCYLAGAVPLACSFSEEKLKLVTVLGAGLLVGTALAVIIPEGVHTMYEQQKANLHMHSRKLMADLKPEAKVKEVAVAAVTQHKEHADTHGTELHTFIGMALVLGFIFMLLVDQLSSGHGHAHGISEAENSAPVTHNRNNVTATLGLVVHAAADGVALGAAASTSQTHVETIVFIAIMLHKAPAAFGLVSFLLHEGFDRGRIRRHLTVFSLAAPVLAILTFISLSQQNKEVLSEINATGIAMLFSAGTFLYVATVHVLPELAAMGVTRTYQPDGTVLVREAKGFSKLELTVMTSGAMLPLLLSLGHHH